MSSTDPYRFWIRALLGTSLLVLLFGPGPTVYAQNSPDKRQFDPERLEGYRNNPDYNYERAVPAAPEPPKKRKEKIDPQLTMPNVRTPGNATPVFKVLLWVLIIGGAILLVFQVLKVRAGKLFGKKSDESVAMADLNDEELMDMELEDPIQKAIEQGQFRIATRLLYLKALKELTARALIDWRREKTNRQYLGELRDQRLRPGFSEITLLFEYIWYGEFAVDRSHFNTAHASFLQFEQTLREAHEK